MEWEVEYTDEFEQWWATLSEDEQEEINAKVELLEEHGPTLPRPHADVITSSKHSSMKELRGKAGEANLRVLYALDPRRTAMLLIGGDKTGNPKWYQQFVPVADRLFDDHLAQTEKRGGGRTWQKSLANYEPRCHRNRAIVPMQRLTNTEKTWHSMNCAKHST